MSGGKLVDRLHHKIFLGRIENQAEDTRRLAALLNIPGEIPGMPRATLPGSGGPADANAASGTLKNWRVTHDPRSATAFSALASRNLQRRDVLRADYVALEALARHGLLSAEAAAKYGVLPVGRR